MGQNISETSNSDQSLSTKKRTSREKMKFFLGNKRYKKLKRRYQKNKNLEYQRSKVSVKTT